MGPGRLGQVQNFSSGIGKNILFGIVNRAEFRPQNRVVESPLKDCKLKKLKQVANPCNKMFSISDHYGGRSREGYTEITKAQS